MTQFNPGNKEKLTYGEALDPIFKITDAEDARQYKQAYIRYTEKFSQEFTKGNTAESIVNTNIGYYAGYGSTEDRERIEKLFQCAHPVFGAIKDNAVPTSEQAFKMGKDTTRVGVVCE